MEDAELEALLREQEEFLKSKKPPAAKVLRRAPPAIGSKPSPQASRPPPLPPSPALPTHGAKDVVRLGRLPLLNPGAARAEEHADPARLLDEHDARSSLPAVLHAEVVERPLVVGALRAPAVPSALGFPRAVHRTKLPSARSAAFAAPLDARADVGQRPERRSGGGEGARGKGEAKDLRAEIHEENVERLRQMSASEIEEARAQLLRSLDPGVVRRLTQPRAAAGEGAHRPELPRAPPRQPHPPASLPTPPTARAAGEGGVPAAADGAPPLASDGRLEASKMEWMGDAADAPPPAAPGEGLPAMGKRSVEEALAAAAQEVGMHLERFDFEGLLVDKERAAAIPVHEGLHHHGEDPAAPGYTLAELMRLSRSTVPAQRVQMLRVLAAVFGALHRAPCRVGRAGCRAHEACRRTPRPPCCPPPAAGGAPSRSLAALLPAGRQQGPLRRRVIKWCVDASVPSIPPFCAKQSAAPLDDTTTRSAQHAALEAAASLAERRRTGAAVLAWRRGRATHASRGTLSAATFSLLESLCHFPSTSQLPLPPAGAEPPSPSAPAASDAVADDFGAAVLDDPLTAELDAAAATLHASAPRDERESPAPLLAPRARFLAAFLPAALAAAAQPAAPSESDAEAMARAAAALHFVASYVHSLDPSPCRAADALLAWAARVFRTHLLPLCESATVRLAAATLAADAPPPPPAARLAAAELLLGHARLVGGLTRLHADLLRAFAAEGAAQLDGTLALLWGLAASLPSRMAPLDPASAEKEAEGERRGLLRSYSRLGYHLAHALHSLAAASPLAPTEAAARRFVTLVACAASSAQCGDESLARELIGGLLLERRWADAWAAPPPPPPRAALLPPLLHLLRQPPALAADAAARAAPRPRPVASLRVSSRASPLPLPADWLAAPLFSFGADADGQLAEEAMLAQLDASLALLRRLDGTPPLAWLPRSRLLCRALQLFTLPLCVWRHPPIGAHLEQLRLRAAYPEAGGAPPLLGGERAVDVHGLLQEVLAAYAAESYGDHGFTQWVLLALRTAEPPAVRLAAWGTLEEMAHRLEAAPPPPHALAAWRRAHAAPPAEGADRLLDAFEASLRHGRLAHARRESFLFRLAVHHLASAAFAGGGAASALLYRLLRKLPPRACLELCVEAGLPHDLPEPARLPDERRRALLQLCAEAPPLAARLEAEVPQLFALLGHEGAGATERSAGEPRVEGRSLELHGKECATLRAPPAEVLSRLHEVDLCGNLLDELPAALFPRGGSWKSLALCRNQLRALPASVRQLQCSKVQLQGNRFSSLPPLPSGVQVLDLSSNALSGALDLGGLAELRTLRLRSNRIARLDLSGCLSLVSIDVADNLLTELPGLSHAEKLTKLMARRNRIRHWPEARSNLVELDLSFNHLSAIPHDLGHLLALRCLWLQHNSLTQIPESVFALPSLLELNVATNRIEALPDLPSPPPALVELLVSSNSLTQLPLALLASPSLTTLDVGRNHLRRLCVESMRSLRHLLAPCNQLASLPEGLEKCTQLRALFLAGNPFGEDTSWAPLLELRSLTELEAAPGKEPAAPRELATLVEASAPLAGARCVAVGAASMNGRRRAMEDRSLVALDACLPLFGVFDGHGGPEAAHHAMQALPAAVAAALAKEPQPGLGPGSASPPQVAASIKTAFMEVGGAMAGDELRFGSIGTTATVALLGPMSAAADECVASDELGAVHPSARVGLWIANVGDSDAVMLHMPHGDPGMGAVRAERITECHRPTSREEEVRICENGGFVSAEGELNGFIAVARALGDAAMPPPTCHEPSVLHYPLSASRSYNIVIASDGLWDFVLEGELAGIIGSDCWSSPLAAATALRDEAYRRGSSDNISVVVAHVN
ncbi:hypothetical protein AB1Y20_018278 [Prymnesium parvum]|uniref:PPM-type phosphatase domain-containing protein n=1 Tax=Prymnesium parvum TaxID=97485 RepID=A0AB34JQ73_PRYPA